MFFYFILSLIQYIVYQLFPDPEIKGRGEGAVSKKSFSAFRASVWAKNKGERRRPWIGH